jgi:hypothetical protein
VFIQYGQEKLLSTYEIPRLKFFPRRRKNISVGWTVDRSRAGQQQKKEEIPKLREEDGKKTILVTLLIVRRMGIFSPLRCIK